MTMDNSIDYEALKDLLKSRLNVKRYYHSLCVMDEAMVLAEQLGADKEKAKLAGLLHDITKNTPDEEQLALLDKYGVLLTDTERITQKLHHAMSGACFVEHELNITDSDIINAIRYHTTAKADMSPLEKVIYMADFISADRDYDGVNDLRELAHRDFDEAMLVAIAFTINELLEKRSPIHPDTLAAWNFETSKKKEEKEK